LISCSHWLPDGQLIGFGRKARRDEPSRQSTLQHVEQIKLGNGCCNWAASHTFVSGSPAPPGNAVLVTSPGPRASPGGPGRAYAIHALPATPGAFLVSLCIGGHRTGGRATLMRISLWIVLVVLMALLAVTQLLRYRQDTQRICADDPSALVCSR